MLLNSDRTFNYETKFLVPVSQREKLMPDLVKQKNLKCSLQSPETVIPRSLVLQNSLLLPPDYDNSFNSLWLCNHLLAAVTIFISSASKTYLSSRCSIL